MLSRRQVTCFWSLREWYGLAISMVIETTGEDMKGKEKRASVRILRNQHLSDRQRKRKDLELESRKKIRRA